MTNGQGKQTKGIYVENKKLRAAWIVLNLLCYVMLAGVTLFVWLNAEGLAEINRLSIWVIMLLCLLFVSVFGSVQIGTWIKAGKL
ncbi:hypothetical protein D3H55_04345 [Bacillus salacetis]|uniref:Uncharacterized protein n=1 Tax=Bacillus salacetis TaxID=2315464 RepID=A0A3A1RAD0_9BACI|nr:hypothetical protein [Bacillus salacetis]RIW37422.1 hypothetical protein D3H55_04345 [Bacillus salacetis]